MIHCQTNIASSSEWQNAIAYLTRKPHMIKLIKRISIFTFLLTTLRSLDFVKCLTSQPSTT